MWMHLGVVDCSVLFLDHCDIGIDLSSIQIVYGAYLLYNMT